METLPPLKHLLLLVQIALVTEHIAISSQASGGAALLTCPQTSQLKYSRYCHRRYTHCSSGEAPVEGSLENLAFVLQCTWQIKGCQKNTTASDNSFGRMKEMPYSKATHYNPFRHTTFCPFCISLLPKSSNLFQSVESKKILSSKLQTCLESALFF